MFKILLLQKLYNLSDPAMEKQLARDLLFRRFVGLSLTDKVPDHSTIWRYHKHLGELGITESLFDQINDQLAQQNIIIKAGSVSIIDASIVEAKNKRPKKGKHTNNTQDNEAAYVSKKDSTGRLKTIYGYKIHLNCDEDSFVKKVETTAANVHDSQCFTTLLTGDESTVYADSTYKSQAHDDYLAEHEPPIENHIHDRAWRNTPLTEQQKLTNTQKSQTRGHLRIRTIMYAKEFCRVLIHVSSKKWAKFLIIDKNNILSNPFNHEFTQFDYIGFGRYQKVDKQAED